MSRLDDLERLLARREHYPIGAVLSPSEALDYRLAWEEWSKAIDRAAPALIAVARAAEDAIAASGGAEVHEALNRLGDALEGLDHA